MTEDKGRIFVEYTVLAMVHIILYYRDVTLGRRVDNLTIKATYKNVLYQSILPKKQSGNRTSSWHYKELVEKGR